MRRTVRILGAAIGCALLALVACSKQEDTGKQTTGTTTATAQAADVTLDIDKNHKHGEILHYQTPKTDWSIG